MLTIRRKITLHNLRNKYNECIVEAVACNMDPHHVLYHSRFYKVLTHNKYKSPQLLCGHIAADSPHVATFRLRNVTEQVLRLQLSSSSANEIRQFL